MILSYYKIIYCMKKFFAQKLNDTKKETVQYLYNHIVIVSLVDLYRVNNFYKIIFLSDILSEVCRNKRIEHC